MTYNVTVPDAGVSPGFFPAQNNTNFMRLLQIIEADHKFNLTAAADDGFHERVSYINQSAGSVPIPTGADAIGYSQVVDLGTGVTRTEVFVDNAQVVQPLAARAFVMFSVGPSPGFAVTVNSSFNVASVVRTATGLYTVTFASPLATAKYATFGMVQPLTFGGNFYQVVSLLTGTDYTTAQTTTSVKIQTQVGINGTPLDPLTVSIFVFGG